MLIVVGCLFGLFIALLDDCCWIYGYALLWGLACCCLMLFAPVWKAAFLCVPCCGAFVAHCCRFEASCVVWAVLVLFLLFGCLCQSCSA
jgi:hypothetical protein